MASEGSHSGKDPVSDGATPPPVARFAVPFEHRLFFTRDVFSQGNSLLAEEIEVATDPGRPILVVIDQGVADSWPGLEAAAERYISSMGRRVQTLLVTGGEPSKNDRVCFDQILRAIHDMRLCRRSCVVCVGGGAVLDVAGYAAGVAHRGVPLIRIPTTVLAQDDAGVGVKNGINAFGKKNFVGCFNVASAVINDELFLATLSDRHWCSGFSEAVKVALLKDASFFEYIERHATDIRRRLPEAAARVIQKCAHLHVQHITDGGDPFESQRARPLDFGHWAAHKIEQMTANEVQHGEAVAIGIAIDVLYAAHIGLLSRGDADRVLDCLLGLGFDLYHGCLSDAATLLDGLEEFREHLGGVLTITLIKSPGVPVDVHEMDHRILHDVLDDLADRHQGSSMTFPQSG